MKLFKLTAGVIERFGVAKDKEEMQKQVSDPVLYPELHFRNVEIQEVTVDGYDIKVTKSK